MKYFGSFLTLTGLLGFLYFKFVVVKLAYAKHLPGEELGSFPAVLKHAYTSPDYTEGYVYGELYGPVSALKNGIYAALALIAATGLILLLWRRKPHQSSRNIP